MDGARFRRRSLQPPQGTMPEALVSEEQLEWLPDTYEDPATVTVLGDPSKEGVDRYRGRDLFAAGGPGTRITGQTLETSKATPEQVAASREGFFETIGAEDPAADPGFDFSDSLHADDELAQMPNYREDPVQRRQAVARKISFDFSQPQAWGGGGGYNYEYTPGADGEVGRIQVTAPDGSRTFVDPRGENSEYFAPIMNEYYRGDVQDPHKVEARETALRDMVGETDADTWVPGESFVGPVMPEEPIEDQGPQQEPPEDGLTDYDRFKAERERAWKDYWVPSETGEPVTVADFGKVPVEDLKYESGDIGMFGGGGRGRWNLYKDLDLYRRMKGTLASQPYHGQHEKQEELLDLLWGPWNYSRPQAERMQQLMSRGGGLPKQDVEALQPLYQEWLALRAQNMPGAGE